MCRTPAAGCLYILRESSVLSAEGAAESVNSAAVSGGNAKVRRGDVTVAKNYMTHKEISTLNLIVNMYLDYAELQAKGHHPMHMADWENKLGDFLRFIRSVTAGTESPSLSLNWASQRAKVLTPIPRFFAHSTCVRSGCSLR